VAIVAIDLVMEPSVFPLSLGNTEASQRFGNRPRGLVAAGVAGQTILAKAALDETQIQTTLTLPANYAYVQRSLFASCRINTGTTNNFAQSGAHKISNAVPLPGVPSNTAQFFELVNDGISPDFPGSDPTNAVQILRLYREASHGHQLLLPSPDNASDPIVHRFHFMDIDAGATDAGTFSMLITFWMYDIDQSYAVALSTPQAVYNA